MPAATGNEARERSRLWYKLNGLARVALARNFGIFPRQYLVNEYPKSGGTWLAQMLSAYLGIPYPRWRLPTLGANVLHSHYLSRLGIRRVVVMWRDPRDVLVSHFYHCVYERPETSAANSSAVRHAMGISAEDAVDFQRQFERFYELVTERRIHPYFTWSDFFDEWFDTEGLLHTSYETLHADAAGELCRLGRHLDGTVADGDRAREVVSRYDFARLAGRGRGQGDDRAYMRKGLVGDWKNVIAPDMQSRISTELGSRLERYAERFGNGASTRRSGGAVDG